MPQYSLALPLMLALQDESQASNEMGFLERIAAEPALVQLFLVVVGFGLLWLVFGRLARRVKEAEARAAVRDYLLAMEQTLSGDLKGAATRLQRVLKEDPENSHARYLYGLVLSDLGDPAEAHKQHLQLQRGMGMESPRNDKALAKNLLAVGHAEEAVEPAARAAQKLPDDREALRLLFRAQLAAGYPEEAGGTGRRLAHLLPVGDEQQRVLEESSEAYALAAKVKLEAGDAQRARGLLDRAGLSSGGSWQIGRLQAQLALVEGGEHAMWQGLDALEVKDSSQPASFLPVLRESGAASSARVLAKLVPKKPYRCQVCMGELLGPLPLCPHCGTAGRVDAVEPLLFREIASPGRIMDAVEENRAHIARLLEQVAEGDQEAEGELGRLGESAVEETLAYAVEHGSGDSAFVRILQGMGAAIMPALFAAYRKRKADWLARFGEIIGRGSSAAVVGRVVQGFGEEALPQFDELLGTEDRDLRKIIIDYFIGLGDPKTFMRVHEKFPPVEVIHRLNETPEVILRKFLVGAKSGSFLVEMLLPDPGFYRDLDVLAVIPDAADSPALEAVLIHRGFNRSLTTQLIEDLVDSRRYGTANRLLDSFGDKTIEHQISAFADLDRPLELRVELGKRIQSMGAGVVDKLCDCFGSVATGLDGQIVDALSSLGRAAVGPLCEAYSQGSLLEKFAGPLVNRYNHRRVMIVRALAAIAGGPAERGLEALRRGETDPNLKLRLAQALHQMSESKKSGSKPGSEDGGGHGQAR